MITYEQQLTQNPGWALREGSMHFDKNNAVHKSLNKITRRLEELGIPYAVVGGLALFFHGFRRFTEDVDLLVSREGNAEIHRHLVGLGYLPPFEKSKNLRDTETGVKIEFLIAGDYPGDGKEKPVSFPEPSGMTVEIDGKQFLTLPKLIELKLASGISNLKRGQDLIDVQRLIEALGLPAEMAEQLNPYVREKFRELWRIAQMPG